MLFSEFIIKKYKLKTSLNSRPQKIVKYFKKYFTSCQSTVCIIYCISGKLPVTLLHKSVCAFFKTDDVVWSRLRRHNLACGPDATQAAQKVILHSERRRHKSVPRTVAFRTVAVRGLRQSAGCGGPEALALTLAKTKDQRWARDKVTMFSCF